MYSYCKYIQDIKVFGEVRPQWDLSIPSTYTSRSNHFKHYKKCHVSSRWKEDISSFVKSQYQSWITFYLQWVLRTTGWVWWHFIQSVNALESHTTHNPAASIGFSKVHLLQFFHDLGPKASICFRDMYSSYGLLPRNSNDFQEILVHAEDDPYQKRFKFLFIAETAFRFQDQIFLKITKDTRSFAHTFLRNSTLFQSILRTCSLMEIRKSGYWKPHLCCVSKVWRWYV